MSCSAVHSSAGLRLVPSPRLDVETARQLAQAAEDRAGTGRIVTEEEAIAMIRLARRIVACDPGGRFAA